MSTENGPKAPRIALKKPDDARRLIRRVLAEIFGQNVQIENAGKIANLLTCWAKLWEMQKTADLETRLQALEAGQNKELKR